MILKELNELIAGKPVAQQLKDIASVFEGKIVFTTSFGIEDQAIAHMIFNNNIPVKIITLDTGRMFPETYEVFSRTIVRYSGRIDVFFPDSGDVEKMVSEKGPFSFYESVENRIECCNLRKVIPLNRALNGMECWISGIRAEQSGERGLLNKIEFDEVRKIFKFFPLLDWSFDEVMQFIRENDIPYNILHDKGFVSIGCQPCTRAVKPGENFRAGRWWWENDEKKECGLHFKQAIDKEGTTVRDRD